MVEVHSIDSKVPDIDLELFVLGLERLIVNEEKELGFVNVICVSDEYLLQMNKGYLQHDYYTDIITFDYCEGNEVSGDLFVSVERVAENASSNDVGLITEFCRVAVHGVLHLCGYGDKSEDEIVQMRSKEEFYLSFCGFT